MAGPALEFSSMSRKLTVFLLLVPCLALGQACNPSRYDGLNHHVCDAVNLAERFVEEGEPAASLAVLKDLPTDGTVAPEIATAVRVERIRAQEASSVESVKKAGYVRSLMASLGSKAASLLTWLILIAIAALIVVAIRAVPRWSKPDKKMLVSFIDRTTSSPSDAANFVLSQEARRLITPLEDCRPEEMREGLIDNGQGATYVNLNPLQPAGTLETALGSAAALDLGIFKLTPQALFKAFQSARQPRYAKTVEGLLTSSGDTTFLSVSMLDARGRVAPKAVWTAASSEANAREKVLREVLAKLVIYHAAEHPSTSYTATTRWRSQAFFQQAMDVSHASPAEDTNAQVQMLLQKSLQDDPSNWMARYNNGLYLHLLGDYDGAKRNWIKLQETLNSKACPASLTRYIAEVDKGFVNSVDYNCALAQAKIAEGAENKEVVSILEDLKTRAEGDLKYLCLSALASAKSVEFERKFYEIKLSSKPRPAETRKETASGSKAAAKTDTPVAKEAPTTNWVTVVQLATKEIRGEIDSITEGLIQVMNDSEHPSRSLALATATARNARGSVRALMNEPRLALDDFRSAMVLDPEFIDPGVNAAIALRDLYRHQKFGRRTWRLEAEVLLNGVLRQDARNREAHYQMGQLLIDPSVFRLEEAADHFAKADPHSWAAFELGNLYLSPSYEKADRLEALKWLRKSERLADEPNQRALTLATQLLRQVQYQLAQRATAKQAGSADLSKPGYDACLLAQDAFRFAGKVAKGGWDTRVRRKAALIEARAKAVMDQIQQAGHEPGVSEAEPGTKVSAVTDWEQDDGGADADEASGAD